MRSFAKALMLSGASLIVAFALAEGCIRAFVRVRDVGPSFAEYDPVYGTRLKRNLSTERIAPEFRMRFATNSLGFRGPEPERFPEGSILFIGDSFTEGYGVNDGEEYPALVRARLVDRLGGEAPPVLNAGIEGVGTGRFLKFLKRDGVRLKPRLIVYQISGNDFGDNRREGLFTLSSSGALIEHDPPPPSALRVVQAVVEAIPGLSYSYTYCLLRQALGFHRTGREWLEDEGPPSADADLPTVRLLDALLTLCREAHWPIVVLTVTVEPGQLAHIRKIAGQYDVPVITTPARSERPDLFYEIDRHWNRKGHELAARLVLDALAIVPGTALN